MKRLSMRPNCSGYRGRSYQPTSGALGLCPTGVKKGPTVNGHPYRYVNVGSAVIGLGRHWSNGSKTGSAATEGVTAWRSGGSSRRRGTPFTWRSTAVIAKRYDGESRGLRCMSDIIKTQRSFAIKAMHHPAHRFDHLYRDGAQSRRRSRQNEERRVRAVAGQ